VALEDLSISARALTQPGDMAAGGAPASPGRGGAIVGTPCGTAPSMAARARPGCRAGPARYVVRTAACRSDVDADQPPDDEAPTVGITLPTVAPIPQCASGMTATCLWRGQAGDVLDLWTRAAPRPSRAGHA